MGDNPNDSLFAFGRPFYDRPHLIKVFGSVILRCEISLGTIEEILPPRIARIGVKWTF